MSEQKHVLPQFWRKWRKGQRAVVRPVDLERDEMDSTIAKIDRRRKFCYICFQKTPRITVESDPDHSFCPCEIMVDNEIDEATVWKHMRIGQQVWTNDGTMDGSYDRIYWLDTRVMLYCRKCRCIEPIVRLDFDRGHRAHACEIGHRASD